MHGERIKINTSIYLNIVYLYESYVYINMTHTFLYINMWHIFIYCRVRSEDVNNLTKHIKQVSDGNILRNVHLSASVGCVLYRCCDTQTASGIW